MSAPEPTSPPRLGPDWLVLTIVFGELTTQARTFRDEYRHLWRFVEFAAEAAPNQTGIQDVAAIRELARVLTLTLGSLRVLGMDIVEEAQVLDRWRVGSRDRRGGSQSVTYADPSRAVDSWSIARRTAPWALAEALHGRGVCGDLTPVQLGALSLLSPEELEHATAKGATPTKEVEEEGKPEEQHDDDGSWHPAAVAAAICRELDQPEARAALFREARALADAHVEARVEQLLRRKIRADGVDCLGDDDLITFLHRLGALRASLQSVIGVLAATRESLDQWFATLPPGFPTPPRPHRQDREFLFRILREQVRETARQVSRLASRFRADVEGEKPPPFPSVAFADTLESQVLLDADRLAIRCPLHLEDSARYLLAIAHECAHGFLSARPATDPVGLLHPKLQGPVEEALFHLRSPLLSDPADALERFVVELVADCVALAVGGPYLCAALLFGALPLSRFAPQTENRPLFDPVQRCRVLLEVVKAQWGGEVPLPSDVGSMVEILGGFIDRYDRLVAGFAKDRGVQPELRADATHLEQFRRRGLPTLQRMSESVLKALLEPPGTVEVSCFTRQPKEDDTAKALLSQLREAAEKWPVGALRSAPGAPQPDAWPQADALAIASWPRDKGAHLDPPTFVRRNTLHLAWSRWFHTIHAQWRAGLRIEAPSDLDLLVFCFVAVEPAGRVLQKKTYANYFGTGDHYWFTLFDSATPRPEQPTSKTGPERIGLFDPFLGPSPPAWWHVLGHHDYMTVLRAQHGPPEEDPTDLSRAGCLAAPYYTTMQEVELLAQDGVDAERWLRVLEEPRRSRNPQPAAGDDESEVGDEVFHFIQRLLFALPSNPKAVAKRLKDAISALAPGSEDPVRVDAVFRSYTWAEVALWVTALGSPRDAVRALCTAVEEEQFGRDFAQAETMILIRTTPQLTKLHREVCAPSESKGTLVWLKNLVAAARPEHGTAPIEFILRVRHRQGRSASGRNSRHARKSPLEALQKVIPAAAPPGSGQPHLELRSALGEEDIVARLVVPGNFGNTDRIRAYTHGSADSAQATQLATALLLLYVHRHLSHDVDSARVETHVMVEVDLPPGEPR